MPDRLATVDLLSISSDRARELLPLLLIVALAGCTSAPPSVGTTKSVKVFYATDRKPDPKTPGEFANDRAGFDRLSYGTRTITVPAQRDKGEDQGVQLGDASPLAGKADFYRALGATARQNSPSSVFLYVHGYNNDFRAAAVRGAVYAHDLGSHRPDPFGVIFSWPSRRRLLAYVGDKDSADLAQPHLTRLIRDLNDETHFRGSRLIFIGHSMGCRALVTAIKNEYFYDGYYVRDREGRRVHRDLPPVCDYLVLIEPDIDLGIFQRDIHLISPLCRRIVVYQSSRDKAIAASTFVHTFPRVGNSVGTKVKLANVDFVNMSTAKTDFLGHSYDHPEFIEELAKRVSVSPFASQESTSSSLEKTTQPVPASVQSSAIDAARSTQADGRAAVSVSVPTETPVYQSKSTTSPR